MHSRGGYSISPAAPDLGAWLEAVGGDPTISLEQAGRREALSYQTGNSSLLCPWLWLWSVQDSRKAC